MGKPTYAYRELPMKVHMMKRNNIPIQMKQISDVSFYINFVLVRKGHVLMNDMWSSLLYNIKWDECDTCSLDVECNGSCGFSIIEQNSNIAKRKFNSVFSSPRDNSRCLEANESH
ncbi:hypothetical protein TNIN_428361 [Trichonephila inaurata madagascariensis]|uniref:Uncharacterized protein n=1 Tax=Trichonephila inaurata madagascariensis TaxID=2747483 RepID=A0A8X7CDB3_9ARAC|nr:hypothetical protein TNIN_428361 [Trichonephila inaurata madagascariensis]